MSIEASQTTIEPSNHRPQLASATGLSCTPPPVVRTPSASLTFITGPTGIGKTSHAIDLALNALRSGGHVCIVDIGRGYMHLVKLLGGSTMVLYPDRPTAQERFGDCPLFVYELEHFAHSDRTLEALPVPTIPLDTSGSKALLIVDELWQASKILPGLRELLVDRLSSGASVVVSSQEPIGTSLLDPFFAMPVPPSVRRSAVHLSRLKATSSATPV